MVSSMTNAQKILANARATLERLSNVEDEFAEDAARREWSYEPLRREPPVSRSTTMTHETPQPSWDDWNEWAESHVARGLETVADIIGDEIGVIERDLHERIAKLEEELGQMRADREIERAAKVIDLPDWRKKSDAA
jgi:hypothetical protein